MTQLNKTLKTALKAVSPEGIQMISAACGKLAEELDKVSTHLLDARTKFDKNEYGAGIELLKKANEILRRK